MKILSNKTYEELLAWKERWKILAGRELFNCNEISQQRELAKELALNFKIRKAIVGTRGTGKTMFIKKTILPQIQNYLLFDMNDEYPEIATENKLQYNHTLDIGKNIEIIKESLKINSKKTIIFEDAQAIPIGRENWLMDTLTQGNFIVVTQGYRFIEKYVDKIDLIYKFRTNETPNNFYEENKKKIINL